MYFSRSIVREVAGRAGLASIVWNLKPETRLVISTALGPSGCLKGRRIIGPPLLLGGHRALICLGSSENASPALQISFGGPGRNAS